MCVGVCQAPERGCAGQWLVFGHVWFYSHMCYSHPEVIRNQSKWTCSPNRKDSTYLEMKVDQWWAMARLPVSQRLTSVAHWETAQDGNRVNPFLRDGVVPQHNCTFELLSMVCSDHWLVGAILYITLLYITWYIPFIMFTILIINKVRVPLH